MNINLIHSLHNLFHYLDQSLRNNKIKCTVALSGGIDSVVLLHILHDIRQEYPALILDAIHINHGISKNSASWQQFCDNLCHSLNTPLTTHQCNIVKIAGCGLEHSARNIRYQFLLNHDTDVIVLAHHQNDQIETMISQILRGSDVHNIASMNEISQKNNKILWRPLLHTSKHDIEQFATQNNITHIDDESNLDIKYLRNFIRHKILPQLMSWDSLVLTKLINVVNNMQIVSKLNDELAINDLNYLITGANNNNKCVTIIANNNDNKLNLRVSEFKALSALRQINTLNYLLKLNNLPLVTQKQMQEFCRQIMQAKFDRKPQLKITDNIFIIKDKNYIFIKHKL